MDEAHEIADRDAAWVRRRFPYTLHGTGESNSTAVSFWSYVLLSRGAVRLSGCLDCCRWPQLADDLLEDMGLPAHRSGGNWLTWPFKPVDLGAELATLKEERDAKRRTQVEA